MDRPDKHPHDRSPAGLNFGDPGKRRSEKLPTEAGSADDKAKVCHGRIADGRARHSYKLLFSYTRMVEDLLRGSIKEAWVEQLDFSTLEKMSGSYVSDDLRDREDDIIWRVRWGEGQLYIYLLLEFQSTISGEMAVRVMAYMALLYQEGTVAAQHWFCPPAAEAWALSAV